MPTFSFPGTNAVTSTVNKPARGTARKKNTAVEDSVAGTEASAASASSASAAAAALDNHDDNDVEVITKEDDTRNEPTFPDVVILKQTDKNYIVKHNNYALAIHETSKYDETKSATENGSGAITGTKTTFITHQITPAHDLVSPNQIYKGQINKKRGRKPKAGFILNSTTGLYDTSEVPNIILHLKCHLSDLKTNDSISNFDYSPSISEVESYNLSTNALKSCDIVHSYNSDTNEITDQDDIEKVNTVEPTSNNSSSSIIMNTPQNQPTPAVTGHTTHKKNVTDANIHVINERHQKEIMKKINRLKYSFHNGETIQMKLNHKCACFWDTCEFDGPIYYTPIMIVNGVFHVSGCYCSPECALASLLKEQMDTSTKFERIHLLHLLYGTSNSTGFKPAPNPNYLLDKYYGNLTIDEFRSLLKGPQMIHVVNKPLTHILPELYEDNNDFLVNSKVIPTNTLKLKKRYKTTLVQSSSVVD